MGLLQVAGNLACRDLHISTAEIQHALEVRNSKAHHWGDAIIKSQSCQKIFPDYFLMLGEYWASSVALPSKKVVIGTHRKYRVNTEKRNNNVLICLSMSDEKYIELVEWILKNTEKNNVPMGTGKYRIKGIDITTGFELEKNQNWWNKENIELRIDTITVRIYERVAEVYNAYKLGGVDMFVTRKYESRG